MTNRFTDSLGLLVGTTATLLVMVVATVAVSATVAGIPGPLIQGDSEQSSLATNTDDANKATASETNTTDQIKEGIHEMHLHIHGSATPGNTLMIEVTNGNDTAVADAAVVMNGEKINMTDEDGHAEITIPDEEELVIEVYAEGADIDSEVRIDIHQHATDANADIDSKVDIEIEADNNGSSQSTTSSSTSITSSQSTTTSSTSQSSSSSIETSTNVTIESSSSDK